jgi:outer membrane lipoprotein SlyB
MVYNRIMTRNTTTGIYNMNRKGLITILLSASALLSVGCNKTEEGATWGAGIGALAGQAIGGDTGATLIGAGVGALLGGAIGNDQEPVRQQQQFPNGNGITARETTTRRVLNADGTYTTYGEETTRSAETVSGYQGLD